MCAVKETATTTIKIQQQSPKKKHRKLIERKLLFPVQVINNYFMFILNLKLIKHIEKYY